MEEIILNTLSGLPTALVLFYVWFASDKNHAKEREEWRSELRASNEILNKVTEQVNQLTFIIQNYVISSRKNPDRG